MKFSLLMLALATVASTACERDERFPKAATSVGSSGTTSLGSLAVPLASATWRFAVGDVGNKANPNAYTSSLTSNAATTGSSSPLSGTTAGGVLTRTDSYTLGISTSSMVDTASYCYWLAGIPRTTGLRVGASLTLKANVRLQDVKGKGVSLVLRGDRGTQTSVLFATTQGKTPILGTSSSVEYSVTLPYSVAVDQLMAYFVFLPGTTGSVTFTDVSVHIN